MTSKPAFTTPEEFAESIGLTPAAVRIMARDGRLASIKTSPGKGGKFLIPTSELDRLLREAEANRRGGVVVKKKGDEKK